MKVSGAGGDVDCASLTLYACGVVGLARLHAVAGEAVGRSLVMFG